MSCNEEDLIGREDNQEIEAGGEEYGFISFKAILIMPLEQN